MYSFNYPKIIWNIQYDMTTSNHGLSSSKHPRNNIVFVELCNTFSISPLNLSEENEHWLYTQQHKMLILDLIFLISTQIVSNSSSVTLKLVLQPHLKLLTINFLIPHYFNRICTFIIIVLASLLTHTMYPVSVKRGRGRENEDWESADADWENADGKNTDWENAD